MKTKKSIISAIILIGLSSLSFSPVSKGKTLIYQSYFIGISNKGNFYVDDTFVCKMKWNEYSIFEVEPGEHIVKWSCKGVQYGKLIETKVKVEPDKTTYIEICLEQHYLKAAEVRIKESPDSAFILTEKKNKLKLKESEDSK